LLQRAAKPGFGDIVLQRDQRQGVIPVDASGAGVLGVRGVRIEVPEPGARLRAPIGGQWVVPPGTFEFGMVELGMLLFGIPGLLLGLPLGLLGLFGPAGLVGVDGLALGVPELPIGAAIAVIAAAPRSKPDRVTDRVRMMYSSTWVLR
jgi:hypothetical protein